MKTTIFAVNFGFLDKHPDTGLTIKEGAGHHFHTEEEKEFIKKWIVNKIK